MLYDERDYITALDRHKAQQNAIEAALDTYTAPQLVARENMTETQRIDCWLSGAVAATPDMTITLRRSTTARPAKRGRAWFLFRGSSEILFTARAWNVATAIEQANDWLRENVKQ